MAPQRRNRTAQNGFAARSQANLPPDSCRDAVFGVRPIICRVAATFSSERMFRKGDWCEFDPNRLPEGVVKNGVSGFVIEIGEDDRVFLGKNSRSAGMIK